MGNFKFKLIIIQSDIRMPMMAMIEAIELFLICQFISFWPATVFEQLWNANSLLNLACLNGIYYIFS